MNYYEVTITVSDREQRWYEEYFEIEAESFDDAVAKVKEELDI